MRHALSLSSSLVALAAFAVSLPAHAVDWYVTPTGTATTGCISHSTPPCSLSVAAAAAVAGDTVYLTSGVYNQQIIVTNSGTADAPITFKADTCSTPIIESPVRPDSDQSTGVYSELGQYLHFEGLVVRGWSTGFGNAWAGGTDSDMVSNGYWEIKNCISYSNGRTGFTFFSAPNYTLVNSISAHNGTSPTESWSSGVSLFEATGTLLVQGVVSFENTDEQNHTDGSGFIVDETTNNASFINNIAFGNSGSCFRLTKSSGTTFVNNTCYHNSQFGSQATGPSNPGELYFTNGGVTIQGVNFANNVIVGTGTAPAGSTPIQNKPSTGWATSNIVTTGAVTYFTAPDGTNPDFTPATASTDLVGKGTTGTAVPTTDVGFDPKCLVKRTPVMYGGVASLTRWQFDIDVDYVTSQGGVAKCFNAGARGTPPEIGAYKGGAVTVGQMCAPTPIVPVATGGAGGAPSATGGAGNATGGAPSNASGGTAPSGGGTAPNAGSGGAGTAIAGAAAVAGAGTGNSGSVTPTAGASSGTPATNSGSPGDSGGGCGCRTASRGNTPHSLAALALLGLAALVLERRRARRM